MIDYTTDALIEEIKRRGSVPTSQQLLKSADFIDFMNHRQRTYLVPSILRTREEFFVSTFDQDLDSSLSPQKYDLPTRAIGHKVRQVMLIDQQDNEVILPRIEPDNKTWHETFAWWPGTKSGYYFEGDRIVLTPNLNNSFKQLRLKYYRRPNWLTLRENCAQVLAVDTGTGIVTIDELPEGWVTGQIIDIIASKPTFRSHGDSVVTTLIAGTAITLSVADAANVVIGDFLCPENESCVPQYPEELHPILVQLGLIDALKALGDSEAVQVASAELEELERNLNSLIKSRDDGAPRKIVSRRGLWDTGGV